MKRGVLLILALLMALPLGCRSKDTLKPGTGQSFAAKVVQAQEGTFLVEVTDAGNSDLRVGAKVEISKDTVSAAGCPPFAEGEYARITLAEKAEETPPGRLKVFSIYKTDESGKVIAD